MRHYVFCHHCKAKFYINTNAKLRTELPPSFTLRCPSCNQTDTYSPYDVFAEISNLGSTGGALLGGLIGLSAGGAGAIVGAILGAALLGGGERAEKNAVARFNES